jgi:DNA-binding FadR family transcriptional regulator
MPSTEQRDLLRQLDSCLASLVDAIASRDPAWLSACTWQLGEAFTDLEKAKERTRRKQAIRRKNDEIMHGKRETL